MYIQRIGILQWSIFITEKRDDIGILIFDIGIFRLFWISPGYHMYDFSPYKLNFATPY